MNQISTSNSNFNKELWILITLYLICFLIAQFTASAILYAFYGNEIINLTNIIKNPSDNLNTIRLAQVISSIICFGVPALLFSKYKKGHIFNYGLQYKQTKLWLWIIVPCLIFTIYPFLNFTYIINKQSFLGQLMLDEQKQYQLFVEALLKPTSIVFYLLNLVVIAILPAFLEEWFFRGTMQRLFSEKFNSHVAIIITSIIFSVIHFEFSAFLPRIVLGIVLGYIFYFSGNIWLAIFTHLFNNGMEVTLTYLKNLKLIKGSLTDIPTMPTSIELIGYTILFIILSILFYRFSKQ